MSEHEPTDEQYAMMRPLFEHPPNLDAIRLALRAMTRIYHYPDYQSRPTPELLELSLIREETEDGEVE